MAPSRALLLALLVASGLGSGAGCARSKAEVRAAETTEADDCTGETPLVAGAPGSPGNLLPSDLHDAGASELAALMRVMQADLARSAEALRAGDEASAPSSLHAKHRRIRCAWPTDPAERTESFDAFAVAYLGQVKLLDEASSAPVNERRAAHNRVVDGCRACHETTCSGPLGAIEKLRVTE